MSEPQMHPAQQPGDKKGWRITIVQKITVIIAIAVFCGLAMSGCGDFVDTVVDLFSTDGRATAQDTGEGVTCSGLACAGLVRGSGNRRIRTLNIILGTFSLSGLDNAPDITIITEGIRIYELRSGGADLSVELVDGGPLVINDLSNEDVIIEGPGGLVTVNEKR